jgi:hypothetical protein
MLKKYILLGKFEDKYIHTLWKRHFELCLETGHSDSRSSEQPKVCMHCNVLGITWGLKSLSVVRYSKEQKEQWLWPVLSDGLNKEGVSHHLA